MYNEMFEKLNKLIENSCSKYFNYPVACILECNDGRLYNGVNIETSSPAAGVCAERNAIFSAISNGKSNNDFKRLYTLNKTDNIITPCFICRQALNDYCNSNLEIISFNKIGEYKTYILRDLCPHAFEEDDLI